MKTCKKCGNEFPNRIVIDGRTRNINKRKYCLKCSPFGKHNTRPLEKYKQTNSSKTKFCTSCQEEKPIFEFYKDKSKHDGLSTYCKTCLCVDVLTRQRRFKQACIEYKGGKCESCDYNRCPAALDFHHREPNKKQFGIGGLKHITLNQSVKNELNKCDLLCKNCHAETHYNKDFIEKRLSVTKTPVKRIKQCPQCQKDFYASHKEQTCCSVVCKGKYQRKTDRPSKSMLELDIDNMSWVDIGKKYGVSDNSVRKWAKQYGIIDSGANYGS